MPVTVFSGLEVRFFENILGSVLGASNTCLAARWSLLDGSEWKRHPFVFAEVIALKTH